MNWEYGLILIVYFIFFLLLFFNMIFFLLICLLKTFDILGPPKFLQKIVQEKFKKYVKKQTEFNKIKPKKNAIYLLMPHGATFIPALRLPFLYDLEDDYPLFFINKWFLLIPGFLGITKFFSGVLSTEKGNLKLAILQKARPVIIYPNGAKEVLTNSIENSRNILPIRTKFLNLLLQSKKNIHIISILNETKCYSFNNLLVNVYRFINRFIDIGIPFPLPYYNGNKLKIHISKSINTKKIKDIDELLKKVSLFCL